MRTSLEMRSKNLKEALKNVLPKTSAEIISTVMGIGDESTSTKLTVSLKGKKICEITVLEKPYKISTPIQEWSKKTTYSGEISSEGFVYSVDTMDECVAEVERLATFVGSEKKPQPAGGLILPEEWPKTKEEQLKLMTTAASQILEGSQYCAIRNVTEGEPCTNIFFIGNTSRSSDRIAAIWPKRNGLVDFLVKRETYEMIDSRVRALGVDEARKDGTEYVYRTPYKKALEMVKIFAES